MKVCDVMTLSPECIEPDAELQDAAKKMKELDVGALPVCDSDTLVGMVTDRDITIRSVSGGRDPKKEKVRDAMTVEVVSCFEDQDVKEAAHLMRQRRVRRLPVLNRSQKLVGIVSLGDLAVECGDDRLTGQALHGISEPASPRR